LPKIALDSYAEACFICIIGGVVPPENKGKSMTTTITNRQRWDIRNLADIRTALRLSANLGGQAVDCPTRIGHDQILALVRVYAEDLKYCSRNGATAVWGTLRDERAFQLVLARSK
jgi:hypothetical protein